MIATPTVVSRHHYIVIALVPILAACGGGGGGVVEPPPPPGAASCASPAGIQLAVGQHQVLDAAASNGCIRLPAPGAAEAEYLFGLVSGSGTVSQTGVTSSYAVRVGQEGSLTTAPPIATPSFTAPLAEPLGWPERFHQALRESERELSARPGVRPAVPSSPALAAPPDVGSERTFKVCSNLQCNQFTDVPAVARAVGGKVAVYLDKTVPASDPLTQADFDDLVHTFDDYHYPISLAAFGPESDLDQNGVVVILLTDAVNALSTDCTNGRILGFFWGGDLLNVTGSNRSEIFYGMVPAPQTPTCPLAGRQDVLNRLKPTMIHEFQHMINFNQHALVRSGQSEVTWLNEALSHLAEELAGRLIPNTECGGFPSCRSQYSSGNLFNAWDYLTNAETHFLVSPGNSSGTLEERGAGWLFVRYLVDQFGTDAQGSNVSKGLVQTQLQGAANVSAVTGQPFQTLVGEWFLAVYLDDLAGFTPQSPRLQFSSWGFRAVFELNCCQQNSPFPQAFPFTPVTTTSAFPFLRTGTLRGGSGRHFRAVLPAGSSAVDVLMSRTSGGPVFDAGAEARVAVVRLR